MTDFEELRNRMVDEQLIPRGIKDPRVLSAMRRVPRHIFVGEAALEHAYGDHAIAIGEGQTISQPYMVGVMTEALDLHGDETVLEVGTGSGYQAAVLAELVMHVYSIERIAELAVRARRLLDGLGYQNVSIKVFNGTLGWKEESPFDRIIVTAGAPEVPAALVEQLAEGGRLIIPVGDRYSQMLTRVGKKAGEIIKTELFPCVFVPLIGEHGWAR
ncbi:MAG TPA: protein-L-isoaspartate(D-aspartate) O-methyltransferase [Nitrospirota bacterium]|nr:protein-L-isoaspartate(D-aspartate) O-methyltransferase [Nitrospirota bacterium]